MEVRSTQPRTVACTHPAGGLDVLFPARDFITGHRFELARCRQCGFVVTTPQLDEAQVAAYYPEGYYGSADERRFPWLVEKLQDLLYSRRARLVVSITDQTRGRVLDVGCGRGLLLAEFRRRGWQVEGTELSDKAARYAREVSQVPVKLGSVETLGYPSEHFDAVTMWHVLEHVPDPRTLLAEASRILKPRGVLMVGVPNFGGFEARFARDKWFHLDVPRHLTHSTEPRLQQALEEAGFQVLRWSGFALEYDSFSFIQSTLNRLGFRHNLLYNILRGKQAKVLGGENTPFWQVLGTLALAAPLGLLSLPATTLAGLVGQGGTMTAFARKLGA